MSGLLEEHAILPVERGGVFHPHCDGWRIVPAAVILDPLKADSRETKSNNGRRDI